MFERICSEFILNFVFVVVVLWETAIELFVFDEFECFHVFLCWSFELHDVILNLNEIGVIGIVPKIESLRTETKIVLDFDFFVGEKE